MWDLSQREITNSYLEKSDLLTFTEAKRYFVLGERVFAIFSPEIAPQLPYFPVRLVLGFTEATESDRTWLVQYWLSHYEIHLNQLRHPISHLIALEFDQRAYTYPDNIIASFYRESK